jgi:hypothetical protein
MTRRPARCTQADIARAINAAKQTGVSMAVEITPDGTIRLTPAPVTDNQTKPDALEPGREPVLW